MKQIFFFFNMAIFILFFALIWSVPLPPDSVLAEPAPYQLTHTTIQEPLSYSPILYWHKNTSAVAYEIEFFAQYPTNIKPDESSTEAVFHTTSIYTNYYNPPLSYFAAGLLGNEPLYWRVRALNLDLSPISPYSYLEPLYTSPNIPQTDAPIFANDSNDDVRNLLYPVYSWIRPSYAASFQVELFNTNPELDEQAVPIDIIATTASEIYDAKPRYGNEPFYWWVRAFDAAGNQLGKVSKVQSFYTSPSDSWPIAVFGDSISHGGGHISYGPEDSAFSWLSYLDFPALNLSQSGDTSQMMVERFDRDVLPFHPHYLLIMGGSNSLRAGIAAEDVIHDLDTIRQKCLQNDIRPILLTLPPINPQNIAKAFDEETADDWQDLFAEVNAYIRTQDYIDTAAPFGDARTILPTKYALDGLHPDPQGKELIAHAINEAWPKITSNDNSS